MTLKEAIEHCKDVALSCTNKECALEHFQLLKWLQEYSNMLEKQVKKPADKVEQKFNIGDEIKTANEEPLTITKIDEKGYWSEDLFICGFDDAAKWELVEQKSTWSEDDELMISRFNNCIGHYYADNFITKEQQIIMEDWLKSLKERYTWKPTEEQVKALELSIVSFVPKTDPALRRPLNELLDQLKKLR